MTRLGLTAAVLAAGALLCSTAKASTITVNAGPNATTFTTLATGFPAPTYSSLTSSPFAVVTGAAVASVGAPGSAVFNTSNISFLSSGPGTLIIWITLAGLTAPPVPEVVTHSGFTANDVVGPVSVTLATFLDPTNGVSPPNGSELLGTAMFTSMGTSFADHVESTGSGPYSLQEVYVLVATGAGANVNLTIDLSTTPVPEPASLGLLGAGLLGIFALKSRR